MKLSGWPMPAFQIVISCFEFDNDFLRLWCGVRVGCVAWVCGCVGVWRGGVDVWRGGVGVWRVECVVWVCGVYVGGGLGGTSP